MAVMKNPQIDQLKLRIKVHDMRDNGYQPLQIAEKLNIHLRRVGRYLAAPKPVMVTMDYYRQAWRDEAACRDEKTELFFPDAVGLRAKDMKRQAMVICHSCPVIERCKDAALANLETHGVWGGEDFSKYSYEFDTRTGRVLVKESDGSLAQVS